MKSCQEEIVYSGDDSEAGTEERKEGKPRKGLTPTVDTFVSFLSHSMFDDDIQHSRWIKRLEESS